MNLRVSYEEYKRYKRIVNTLKNKKEFNSSQYFSDLEKLAEKRKREFLDLMGNKLFDPLEGVAEDRKKRLIEIYNNNDWRGLTIEDEEDLAWMWHHDAERLKVDEENWDKLTMTERNRYREVYQKVYGLEPAPQFMKEE